VREKKEIYYIIGDDEKVLRNSPLLEAYKKADIEVLIMDDKEIDEIVTPSIGTFKEWSLKDITTIDAPESKSKDEIEKVQKELEPLVTRIKSLLEDEIKDVKVTSRLTKSPSCVVKDASDPMASMAHMFAQMGQDAPEIPLILEINPDHELIKKMTKLEDNQKFKDLAWILLDSAKLAEGLEPKDKSAFSLRIAKVATEAI